MDATLATTITEPLTGLTASASLQPTPASGGIAELAGDDFFNLLIAQLTNQDPLEPTSNEELLQQLSSIREIELSSTLTDSLKSLTGQQQLGAASSMLGRFVVGQTDPLTGQAGISGTVVGVRFTPQGETVLALDNGMELPAGAVESVMTAEQAAQALVGRLVGGVDARDPNNPRTIEGIVTGVTTEGGQVLLELDTAESIRMQDVATIAVV